MVDLVLKAEQVRSAPREVKDWIGMILMEELALESGPVHRDEHAGEPKLAECSPEEAGLVLEQIRDDYLACQVFFELCRDTTRARAEGSELHRIAIQDILRHTRLGDAQHLAACLDRISEAFQAVRRDPDAALFAFDRTGGLYVHETTRRSIKALWQALVMSRLPSASELPGMAAPAGPAVPVEARPAA
jgi:hypothetical protein